MLHPYLLGSAPCDSCKDCKVLYCMCVSSYMILGMIWLVPGIRHSQTSLTHSKCALSLSQKSTTGWLMWGGDEGPVYKMFLCKWVPVLKSVWGLLSLGCVSWLCLEEEFSCRWLMEIPSMGVPSKRQAVVCHCLSPCSNVILSWWSPI